MAVAIVLYLGFNSAAEHLRTLWASQSNTLLDSIQQGLVQQLEPVREQSRWIARDIREVHDLASFDDYLFGALAATPQIAGATIVTTDAQSRRWNRKLHSAVSENWSHRPEVIQWLAEVEARGSGAWNEPVWIDEIGGVTTLLYDTPLYNTAGEFIGVFAQIVPLNELSSFLARNYAETGLTPFILYDRRFVLSHPMLINATLTPSSQSQPLATIESLGDIILTRIWTPDDKDALLTDSTGSKLPPGTVAQGVYWGDSYYLYLYRDIDRYGDIPWTIGAYLNTEIYNDGEGRRLISALVAGCLVLLVAVAASVFVGRKVSRPIKEIARAAVEVDAGRLEAVNKISDSPIRELDEAGRAFNNMVKGLHERALIRRTLGRFVPEAVASSLLDGGGHIKPTQVEATILFCDIESFTKLTESLGPIKIVEVLNSYFSAMVEILERHGGVVTQFQGDAILATFNVPIANVAHANDAIAAAAAMLAQVRSQPFAGENLAIRIGINTGTVVAGAIGAEGRLNYTVHGDAVNLAARLESMNKVYATQILVAEDTKRLATNFHFSEVGEASARGQTRSITLYTLASALSTPAAN